MERREPAGMPLRRCHVTLSLQRSFETPKMHVAYPASRPGLGRRSARISNVASFPIPKCKPFTRWFSGPKWTWMFDSPNRSVQRPFVRDRVSSISSIWTSNRKLCLCSRPSGAT